MPTTGYKEKWNRPELRSGARRVIEVEHSNIHEGIAFHADHVLPTLANNGTLLMELIVPANKIVHMKDIAVFVVGVPFSVELIEAPTLTTGSTTITPKNRNRAVTTAADLVIKTDPTAISGGTVLEKFYAGGGSGVGATKSGGDSKKSNEWLLDAGTYLVRITNLSGSTNLCSISLDWGEY